MSLAHSPLSSNLGVEVHADPALLTDDAKAELSGLFRAHHLLLFRGRPVSIEQQRDIASLFGEVTESGRISNTREDGTTRQGELLFHNDMAFEEKPLHGISLYAEEVSPASATTRFANGARAAVVMPDELRARLEGLAVRFMYVLGRGDRRTRWEEAEPAALHATHPAFYASPGSGGRAALIISELQTDRVLGVSEEESEELIAASGRVMYAPDNVYEHHWREHDVIFWDNVAVQHARGNVRLDEAERTLRRVAWGTERGYAGLRRLGHMPY